MPIAQLWAIMDNFYARYTFFVQDFYSKVDPKLKTQQGLVAHVHCQPLRITLSGYCPSLNPTIVWLLP